VSIKRRRPWWDILCMLVKCRKLRELHFAAGASVEPPSVLEILISILPALVTIVGYIRADVRPWFQKSELLKCSISRGSAGSTTAKSPRPATFQFKTMQGGCRCETLTTYPGYPGVLKYFLRKTPTCLDTDRGMAYGWSIQVAISVLFSYSANSRGV
jgi:hypothetical protein